MSRITIPRGTARAIRRGNVAPSIGFAPMCIDDEPVETMHEVAGRWLDQRDADRAYYRDLREEGYSHQQAMLMSGLGDPDSLGCT